MLEKVLIWTNIDRKRRFVPSDKGGGMEISMAHKFREQAVVIRQDKIAPGIFSLWLKTEKIAAHAKAGQFISMYCDDGSRLLPRPISICEIDREDSSLHLVYRIAGKGTDEFSKKTDRGSDGYTGTLGKWFPIEK